MRPRPMSTPRTNSLQRFSRLTCHAGRVALVIATLVLLSRSAAAQPVWERLATGIFGADVRAFTFDGAGTTWASTGTGLYRFDQAARIWRRVSAMPLESMAFAPDGSLLGVSVGKLLRSTDQGRSWAVRGSQFQTTRIHVAPNGSAFAISRNSISRSIDSGRSWSVLTAHTSITESPYFNLCIAHDGTLFAISLARTQRSTDNGTTWQTITTPFPFWDMIAAANGDLVASSYTRIHISHDGGTTWANGSSLIPASMAAGSDGTLYAIGAIGASAGIHRSTNNGSTWTRTSTRQADLIGAGSSDNVWIASGDSVLVSTDRGTTWRAETGADSSAGLAGAILEAPDGDLVVSASGTLFRSTDNGERWSLASSEPAGYIVGIDSGGAIYTFRQQSEWFPGGDERTITSLFQSTDRGGHWRTIPAPGDLSAIDLTQPGMLAAGFTAPGPGPDGPASGGVSISTDGGRSWDTTTLHLACDRVAVMRKGKILAGVYEQKEFVAIPSLYSSSDSGRTWEPRLDSLTTSVLTVAPNGIVYLVGTRTGYDSALGTIAARRVFLRSIDEGVSWESLLDSGWITDLFVAPSGRLYYRIAYDNDTRNWLTVVSGDNGESWTELTPRYEDWIPRYLLELPGGDVIASYNDTLFRSADNGRTWRSIQFDLPYDHVGRMIGTRSGHLFVETVSGIYRASIDAAGVAESVHMRLAAIHIGSPRPNPLGISSTIPLELAAPMHLRVTLCDILGRELRLIHDGMLPAGTSELILQRSDLPAGVYMLVVRSADGVESQAIPITRR